MKTKQAVPGRKYTSQESLFEYFHPKGYTWCNVSPLGRKPLWVIKRIPENRRQAEKG